MLIQLFKNSRGKSVMNFDKKSRENPAKWFGLTTDSNAVELVAKSKDHIFALAASDLQLEINPRLNISKASSKDDEITAHASDVALAVGIDPDAANSLIALHKAIHKRLLNNLKLFAPHTNPSKLRNPGPQTMCEIPANAIDDIITQLRNRANILYNEYLDQGTALPGSFRKKKNAQSSAIARDKESTERMATFTTGPEDPSMCQT